MVAFDENGQPSGLHYQLLAPMLLNELQKEHKLVLAQQEALQRQVQQIAEQQEQAVEQRQEIQSLKLQLQQQNAALQERLSRLESLVSTAVAVHGNQPPDRPVISGESQ